MKTITARPESNGNQHFVLKVGSEPIMIDFISQIDDIMISSPDGDVLVAWDSLEWKDDECMIVREGDKLKEINNLRCTKFLMRSKNEETLTVYLTSQRN